MICSNHYWTTPEAAECDELLETLGWVTWRYSNSSLTTFELFATTQLHDDAMTPADVKLTQLVASCKSFAVLHSFIHSSPRVILIQSWTQTLYPLYPPPSKRSIAMPSGQCKRKEWQDLHRLWAGWRSWAFQVLQERFHPWNWKTLDRRAHFTHKKDDYFYWKLVYSFSLVYIVVPSEGAWHAFCILARTLMILLLYINLLFLPAQKAPISLSKLSNALQPLQIMMGACRQVTSDRQAFDMVTNNSDSVGMCCLTS